MTAHSAPRDDRGSDKRERILDAAERIFARHGFFAAKVADVAKEAGVADGTIYLYFKSKDELLISLFERRMHQLNGALKAAIAGKPPREQLRAFIRTHLQLVHDEPAASEVLTIELRQSNKFMKEYDNPAFVEFLRMLGGIIAAAQDAGELDASIPAHATARMIFGVLDELALAWVLTRQGSSIEPRSHSGALPTGGKPRSSIIEPRSHSGALPTGGKPRSSIIEPRSHSGALPTGGKPRSSISSGSPGTRPKKFDIVRAADWVITLVETGLVTKKESV